MKKFSGRDFIGGVLLGSLLFSGVSYASSNIKLIVNDKEIHSDVPPQVISGRTMVPARFLAESLGAKVEWDSNRNAVVVTRNEGKKDIILEMEHLSIPLPQGWTFVQGLDSYAIKKDGKNIGALNVLGYASSVENLLPNGAEVLEKKKVENPNATIYSVKLITRSSAASPQAQRTEIHYLYILDNKKTVYDLSFDLGLIGEDTVLNIEKNAKIK
jgi:hypothetical protein